MHRNRPLMLVVLSRVILILVLGVDCATVGLPPLCVAEGGILLLGRLRDLDDRVLNGAHRRRGWLVHRLKQQRDGNGEEEKRNAEPRIGCAAYHPVADERGGKGEGAERPSE
eukprot:scaffold75245_cov29-Tisochrysis_lutea.AAC.7